MRQFPDELDLVYAEMREAIAAAGIEAPLVRGNGPHDAKIVLVGEAPGKQEVEQGLPFVGKAGKNLDAFLAVTGLKREELYVTNVVKMRPYKVSERGTVSNRPPTKKEIALFLPHLLRELDLLQPKLVITLGNVALEALVGRPAKIGSYHGVLHTARERWRIYPLYHPASIIYNPSLKSVYHVDLESLKTNLKQDNYYR